MNKVIAALDTGPSAGAVLDSAASLAEWLGAAVEAVHVREAGDDTSPLVARRGPVDVHLLDGEPATAIVQAARRPDVVALALGSRARPSWPLPAGHVTLAVLEAAAKPVLVVPPGARRPSRVRSLLVPLGGDVPTSRAVARTMGLLDDDGVDVVVLHVLDAASLPPYEDQPQHETPAWRDEFVRRYCAWSAPPAGTLELRIGSPAPEIADVALALDPDLVLLGWSGHLSGGRATVVRELLGRGATSLLLVPVGAALAAVDPVAGPMGTGR